jgi:hypothetical protein
MQAADRSKTALFGWELGANLGHLSAIARLVDRFTSAGFTLVFAVPDVVSARLVLPETALVIPAPGLAVLGLCRWSAGLLWLWRSAHAGRLP